MHGHVDVRAVSTLAQRWAAKCASPEDPAKSGACDPPTNQQWTGREALPDKFTDMCAIMAMIRSARCTGRARSGFVARCQVTQFRGYCRRHIRGLVGGMGAGDTYDPAKTRRRATGQMQVYVLLLPSSRR